MALKWLRQCVEIPLLLVFYSFIVTDPVGTNFVIYRTCYVTLGYNRTDCEKLGTRGADNATQELEKLVQPSANTLLMTQSLSATILPALLCLFIGPWSDTHGRKPVLISCLAGYTISSIIGIIVVLMPGLSPWYLLVSSLPSVIFGGFSALLMAALAYVTDITTTEKRGMRLGIIEGTIAFGMLLGNLTTASIFNIGGYLAVFGTGTICYLLAFLYCIFVLTETVVHNADQDGVSIFSCDNIYDMMKAVFKSRENYNRCILLISMLMAVIFIMGSASDSTVFFMFLRQNLNWDLQKFTLFRSIRDLIWIAGTFLGLIILHKLLKIKEAPLLLVGFVAYCTSAIVQGLATTDWYIYAASLIRCISGIISPMCRSLISRFISNDENGKVFSVVVTVESLMLALGGPLYTLLYNYTLHTNPGVFNFLTVGIFGLEIILVIIVIILQKKFSSTHTYSPLLINADD